MVHTPTNPICDYLISHGYLSKEEIHIAHSYREAVCPKKTFIEALLRLELINEDILFKVLTEKTGISFFDLNALSKNYNSFSFLPLAFCQHHHCLVVNQSDNTFHIAAADPTQESLKQAIFKELNKQQLKNNAPQEPITVKLYFAHPCLIEEKLKENKNILVDCTQYTKPEQCSELIFQFIEEAWQKDASDIHWVPEKHLVNVFYRLDGLLTKTHTFDKKHWHHILNRLKVLGQLDIAEMRLPQSGQLEFDYYSQKLYCRLSTHPTIHSESIVLRFLNRPLLNMESLGLNDLSLSILKKAIHQSYGLIVLCGPTGAGKTTTLYAILNELKKKSVHIATLEDPVECAIPGIRQTDLRPLKKNGFYYAQGIESLLRQDLDIMMIGEIRHADTAQMAVRAALTGHLVLTTLHTQNTHTIIPRFLDLGVDEKLIKEVLLLGMAQQLLPKKCTNCQEAGCEICNNRGHKGRVLIEEIKYFKEEEKINFEESYRLKKELVAGAGFEPTTFRL